MALNEMGYENPGDAPIKQFNRGIDTAPQLAALEVNHLDWRDLLPTLRVPSLVCVGRQSKVFPWQGSAYVGEHIPGAKTVFFEKSGHMPFYEEPEKFNLVVRTFIQA